MSNNTVLLATAAQKLHGSSATGITASERSLYDTKSLLSQGANTSGGGPQEGEGWRAFGSDTETGRMMNRLYGGQNKPIVNYPVLKKRKPRNNDENAKWMPSSSGGNNVDPKSTTFNKQKALSLKVPKNFGHHNNTTYAPVDYIQKKKPASACHKMIDDTTMRQSAYRPPNINAFSTIDEKARLGEIFQHKGGKALPAELTHMVGPVPSEVRSRNKELERVEEMKSLRRARLNGGVDPMLVGKTTVVAEKRSNKDMLFDQIYGEIKERRTHQEAMEDSGAGQSTRRSSAQEISQRISRLKGIDPGRAAEVLQEMYS